MAAVVLNHGSMSTKEALKITFLICRCTTAVCDRWSLLGWFAAWVEFRSSTLLASSNAVLRMHLKARAPCGRWGHPLRRSWRLSYELVNLPVLDGQVCTKYSYACGGDIHKCSASSCLSGQSFCVRFLRLISTCRCWGTALVPVIASRFEPLLLLFQRLSALSTRSPRFILASLLNRHGACGTAKLPSAPLSVLSYSTTRGSDKRACQRHDPLIGDTGLIANTARLRRC